MVDINSQGYNAYKVWAPDSTVWSQWAKPVAFAGYGNRKINPQQIEVSFNSGIGFDVGTAVIVDLPGVESVKQSLALAREGYRPVPLYNGVIANSVAALDTDNITGALFGAQGEIASLFLSPEAPPVFMLDSLRMSGPAKQPGTYDNRWCVFVQDMPSALFLKKSKINRVVVYTDDIQQDLTHILRRYQEEGIQIARYNGSGAPYDIQIYKPSKFKSFAYRFSVIMGLKRNAAGGFGARIPDPYQGGRGGGMYYGGYYRMG